MNRKQRRAQGGSIAPAPAIEPAAANALAEAVNAAFANHQAGAFDEAERLYRHILSFRPDHPDLRSRLGAVLMAQGKTLEAITELELAVVLQPDLFAAHANLAQAYLAAGRVEMALEAAMRALEMRDTPPGRTFLARCLRLVRLTADDGRVRRLVLRALVEGWARPRDLTGVCISIIKLNTSVSAGIAKSNAAWPARLPAAELTGSSSAIAALSNDELLCRLLEHDPLTDIGLERLLTNIRGAMLTLAASEEEVDERFLDFYCSLARQCFLNDYVYAITESEAELARQLRSSVEKALASGETFPVLRLIVVAAYFPLHSVSNAESLLRRPWPQSVQAVIIQQVTEPTEERSIAATIAALTPIEPSSVAGNRQIEEGAYPRWVLAPAQQPLFGTISAPPKAMDIFIAGCGSGLSAVELARQANNARVLAVDLNLASLSYGKRMAQNLSLTNLEFAQADVMKCGSLGQRFDFIDVSGLLDHLAEPWEGWRILLGLLRPGGRMQVGVYSAAAHRKVSAARALVDARGYQAHSSDIRRCREDLVATDDPLARSVTQWEDFFTTSECRYMLFGVHEQPMTLRAIKSFLASNAVQFAGFIIDAATRNRFVARFADPAAVTDLDSWAKFEAETPEAFPVTYQFWINKPAEAAGSNPAQSGLGR
jgi:2-polyprenyl-3-methyl-5-hydroxy-6-metoxy-1,4-benzoquinol methylase/tetratricopeptide (TPR) repeat protein